MRAYLVHRLASSYGWSEQQILSTAWPMLMHLAALIDQDELSKQKWWAALHGVDMNGPSGGEAFLDAMPGNGAWNEARALLADRRSGQGRG